jgi:SnoaL-like polyketide cyclase
VRRFERLQFDSNLVGERRFAFRGQETWRGCRWESWADNRAQLAGLPTLQPRIGPAGVADFFVIAGQLEFHDFQILDTVGGERQVVAEVTIAYTTLTGAEGDRVAVRWTGRGTHTGEPLMGVPASGAPVTARGVYLFRIVDGKIVEVWGNWDNLNVVQQLGGLPTPS